MEHLLRAGPAFQDRSAAGGREADAPQGRDLFMVAQYLVPTDACVIQGCLVAGGVPAVLADANHVQANLLLAPALGGVRVLVPQVFLQQARDILAAFERGEYALSEDADVGLPSVPGGER
jgi:hypothetical protein